MHARRCVRSSDVPQAMVGGTRKTRWRSHTLIALTASSVAAIAMFGTGLPAVGAAAPRAQATPTTQPIVPTTAPNPQPAAAPPLPAAGAAPQPASGAQVVAPPPPGAQSEFAPRVEQRRGVLVVVFEFPAGQVGVTPVRTAIDGPAIAINTDKAAAVAFTGVAGQTIAVTANRPWQLEDPLGRVVASSGLVVLQDTGQYVLSLGEGLAAPATVQIRTNDPSSIVLRANVSEVFSFDTTQTRPQLARMTVKGGQRYRLSVPASQPGASFCVEDWTSAGAKSLGCANGADAGNQDPLVVEQAGAVTFIPTADQDVAVTGSFSVNDVNAGRPATIRARIVEAANDLVIDTAATPIVQRKAEPGQAIVLPFWGSPAERGVVSSPIEADAKVWGDPWIDREAGVPNEPSGTTIATGQSPQKVFATPIIFNPTLAPFVTWRGAKLQTDQGAIDASTKRYGVFRGEDRVISVPTTGEPVVVKNLPWFAAIASMTFEPGDRYVVQVTGKNLRPLGLALRDPSGKFSSNRSPWQWTTSDTEQRAITNVTADRAGRWALEMRPSGDSIKDLSVSVLKVGSGGSYLGAVDVDDVLNVGEKTDVQLGPNEFARLQVKLTTPTAQLIMPEVLRFRTKTFQPTAADMSLWDGKGRLVWSNNRNLEEEVLSGRLGKEPEIAEKDVTVSGTDLYTLIVSPKSDLAGRYRVSVTSAPVVSDVRLGDGPIPRLLGGTKTGVLEVRSPTRYRVTGTSACITSTSVAELAAGVCINDGRTTSLSPGVYRFQFQGADPKDPLKPNATFSVVAPGTAPDSLPSSNIAIDGASADLPRGSGEGVVSFAVAAAGTRLVALDSNGDAVAGVLERPDGDRQNINGSFVTPLAGNYRLLVALKPDSATRISLRRPVSEVQTIAWKVNPKPRVVTLTWGQRLEVNVTVPKKGRIVVETFTEADANSGVNFLYAASAKEERYADLSNLAAGTYRLVFVGTGQAKITIRYGSRFE